MANDPRILLQIIDDLSFDLGDWSRTANEICSTANFLQIQTMENASSTMRDARRYSSEFKDMIHQLEIAENSFKTLRRKCDDICKNANDVLNESDIWREKVGTTTSIWQGKLQSAEDWLNRATARLERAVDWLTRAIYEFESAHDKYEEANRRLRSCYNDRERKTCASEERSALVARQHLEEARENTEKAQKEVEDATEEKDQASQKVTACQNALSILAEADEIAITAQTIATSAVQEAMKALDIIQKISKILETAQKARNEADKECDAMEVSVMNGQSCAEEAANFYNLAEDISDQAQHIVHAAIQEMENRMDLLRELNRPTLE